jgi:hypothetical protein
MLSESVILMRVRGQHAKLYIALAELSHLERSQGKLLQALEHIREALLTVQEIGHRPAISPTFALAMIECASCLEALGALEHAAQVGGEAQMLLERMDTTLPVIYYRRYRSKLEGFKAQANDAKWTIWWADGRALS